MIRVKKCMVSAILVAFIVIAALAAPGAVTTGPISTEMEASALSTAFNCEVYNTSPISMSLSTGQNQTIKKVYKYAFRIKDADTFSSLENVIKGLSGKTYKPSGFTWVSADEKIATVSSGGKVTGVSSGTTYIYPVPKSICNYKIMGKYVLYTDINILDGLKARGAFGLKVKVK